MVDEMTSRANVRRNLIAAFVSVAIFAPILYMLIDRQQPYEWLGGKIIPNDPKPGEWMEVEWTVKINRVCEGYVQREIVMHDGSVLNYDAMPTLRRDQLSGNMLYRQFPLSSRALPGPAKYRAYTCYVCNPLQHWWPVCVRTPDVAFTISAPAVEHPATQPLDSSGK